MNFKAFLQKKGITDDAFKNMDAAEQAKLHGEFLDELSKSVEGAAKSEDIDALKQQISDLTDKGIKPEQLTEIKNQIDTLATQIAEYESKGGKSAEKGTFEVFVEKNIADNKLTKDNPQVRNASYSANETLKAPALMTTANVIPNVAGGFSPLFGNYIDPEVGHTPKPDNIFMDLVTVKYQPGTETIWYTDRINEEGTAQFIAEGATKPLADAEWKTTSKQTKEVAIRWKMTNRLMFHAPSVVEDFREHANELVDQVVDDQILTGDGTGNNLDGIIANAGAFIVPAGLAEYYADANIYDVLAAMATQIRLANYKGQIEAVLNTVWWAKMAGTKDGEGRYLIVPFRSADGKTIFDVRVHFTNKMDADDILVGVLKNYNLVISEDAIYAEGYENDDFSKNLVSKKIESFMQGYIKQSKEGSILYANIADVLTDIEQPVTP